MRSIRSDIENEKPVYPYLGIHECGTIVLFGEPRHGVCVSVGEDAIGDAVGIIYDNWNEKMFSVYDGKITLSN